jgi:hypothetical protein
VTDARRANVAALAVILLAGALSALWAFRAPIFQAPDEPAHFDYSISIYNAGRLVRVSDGKPDWIVSPYTKYLMTATDWERLAWHSSMRAPSGYGSRPYFAKIDADAPSIRAAAPSSGVNYIAPYYPFGFYALEALWMRAVSLFTGSLVAVFFSARLLCVFLMMIGLYFNYRTALNLGIPRWTSVALLAAVGFFPLTSFVSSYVQPDNLVYALVSASLFFATELRPGQLPFRTVAALGVALGLLAITKYQFFLSAAIPIGLFVILRTMQARLTAPRRIGALAMLIAPTIALLAVQYVAVNRAAGAATVSHTDMNADYLRGVVALGFAPLIRYVVASALSGFTNCFITGGCAATFWQTIGWVDTPIVIVSRTFELWVRVAIGLTTMVVAVVLAFFFCRNAIRLLLAAARGHARASFRAIAGDPVFNTYICFGAIMLALYVVTNNAFGIEGRQLYPFIFPAVLCFVWYAPRALRKRHQALSAALACVLVGYAFVASAYAYADLTQRYYGPPGAQYAIAKPPPSQLGRQEDGVLWPVVSAEYHVSTRNFTFAFPRGSRLLIDGSALLPGNVVPSTVAVLLDGLTALPVLANQYLYPVAEITHNINDGYSGFYATFDTVRLREGPHVITAYAKVPGEMHFAPIRPTRLFFVTEAGARFSPAFLRELEQTPAIPGSLERTGGCNGGAALFAGQIGADSRGARYSAVWLLVDGRPYPARYDDGNGSFVGTIPTGDLALGAHAVSAYATSDVAHTARIASGAVLSVETDHARSEFLRNLPAVCADPLAQLERV